MSTNTDMLNTIEDGLDENQRLAMTSVNGPVRIIAGAGAGKTRTITRRIAYACVTGEWNEKTTLAVTYTNKAALEMKTRLASLGVQSVQASTFHSAAMSQLAGAWSTLAQDSMPQLETNFSPHILTALQRVLDSDDFTAQEVGEIAQEMSWQKVNLIPYEDYERITRALAHPIPMNLTPQQMSDIAQEVEKEKSRLGIIDFDDALLLLSHILEQYEEIADDVCGKIRHITVDEYQDVSPLQHKILTQWLGDNRDICVVGDAAQTIYSYAGATSYYLLNFDKEFAPLVQDVILNKDYRSTGNIVGFANAVLAASEQSEDYIQLISAHESGARVTTTTFADDDAQAHAIVSRIKWHAQRKKPLSDIAILCRTRAKARFMAQVCEELDVKVSVKTDRDDNVISSAPTPDAVTVSTIHAAKGLEWDTVFIPDCFEGNIPVLSSVSNADRDDGHSDALYQQIEEERRVFYVALTRGEKQVYLTYPERAHGGGYGAMRSVSRFITQAHTMNRKMARLK